MKLHKVMVIDNFLVASTKGIELLKQKTFLCTKKQQVARVKAATKLLPSCEL